MTVFYFSLSFCFVAAIEVNITNVKQKLKLDQNKLPHKTTILFLGHLKNAKNMQLGEQRKLKRLLNSSV